jgi:hypothetical protein
LNRKGAAVHWVKTVGDLLEQERLYLLTLQSERFAACVRRSTFVDSHSLARADTVRYSVPVEWAYHPCVIEVFVDQARIWCVHQLVAVHERCYIGGWFRFEMKVLPDAPAEPACLYWGSDGPGRDFDILVGDKKIATEHLNQNRPVQFFTVTYGIPPELTKDKTKVTVKFKAHQWRTAGGLFECRTVRAD